MKVSRIFRGSVALTAALAVAFSGAVLPSNAAVKTSVVTIENNGFTSLNSSVRNYNLATNSYVNYLTGQGFYYIDDKLQIVPNKTFGTFRIAKETATDFRSEWKLNKGLVWNDGTEVTVEDMLLTHMICSNKWAIDAGLGDPVSAGGTAFNAACYTGTYNNTNAGEPIVGKDGYTLTQLYKYPIPDWELFGPGTFPVHTLIHLVDGKTTLGSAAENKAAKAKFLAAYTKKDTALLKKIADVWSKQYITKSVDKSTNPNLLVRNGAFNIQEIVSDQSITMVTNPKYNTGPKPKIKTVVIKIVSSAAAAQALANKEADIFSGQATVDSVRQLGKIPGVKTIVYPQGVYEHVDVRTRAATAAGTPYKGVFAITGDATADAKAKDLRTAFLLSVPRKEIELKLVRRINPRGELMNSLWTLTTDGLNKQVTANNGSKVWGGTDDARVAQALALVKKHYPNASATNPGFTIKMNWGNPADNPRRVAQAALIVASAAKAGIKVINDGKAAWGANLSNIEFDVSFFAWQKTSPSPLGSLSAYRTAGGANYAGWSHPVIDENILKLERKTTPAEKVKIFQAIDKVTTSEALSLPLFQHTAVVAHNAALKNVKPSSISPIAYWNFWEWTY
ncbi:MAG: hypothetical protein RL587_1192 [Actinomycetota bacterium]